MKSVKQSTLINYLCEDQQVFYASEDETIVVNSEDAKLFEKLEKYDNNIKVTFKEGIPFLENIVRICSHCGKRHAVKHDKKERILHFFEYSDVKIKVQRYLCKKCGKTFMTNLSPIVPKFRNFTNDFKTKLINLIRETEVTLFGAKFTLEKEYDVSVSHQTIENYIIEDSKHLEFDRLACKGYLLFDVEWVKIKGKWKYRFALFDMGENRIIADKIYDSENNENIYEFLKESTKNITVKCITTDLAKNYRPILSKLGYNQQFCLFHTKMIINKYINNKLKRLNKSRDNVEKKVGKIEFDSNNDKLISLINKYDSYTNEINKYERLKQELYEMLDEKDIDKTRYLLNKILKKINNYKGQIKSFIKNRLQDQFMDFNRWKKDEHISRTTSPLENAFSKTMSKKYKRKYRTKKGIMARIYLNEERWEDNQKRRNYYKKQKPT